MVELEEAGGGVGQGLLAVEAIDVVESDRARADQQPVLFAGGAVADAAWAVGERAIEAVATIVEGITAALGAAPGGCVDHSITLRAPHRCLSRSPGTCWLGASRLVGSAPSTHSSTLAS